MTRHKIAIDAGHGTFPNRNDPGAVGPTGLREADVNKAVAERVVRLLERQFDVVVTRDEQSPHVRDTNTDLWNRVRRANDQQADIFISIHCNGFNDPSANGTETFCHRFGTNGERLARSLQDNMLRAVPLRDRGVKTAGFYVLRKTDMPAALIELAFITNPREEAMLRDSKVLDSYALAIARSASAYFGITLQSAPPEPQEDEYLGEFEVTHYCHCEQCCGKKPDHPAYKITSSGALVKEGHTVAVDTDIIPFGTKLKLVYPDGTERNLVAEDRGSAIRQNRLDVYMESHQRALRAGRIHGVRVYKTGTEKVVPAPKKTSGGSTTTIAPLPPTHPAMMPVDVVPQPAFGMPFKDVTPSHWGLKHIARSKERGIIKGDGAGYFYPEEPASRQALITINEKTIEYIFQKLKEAGIHIQE